MRILLNSNNEITSYAIVGGFENGVEVNEIPNDFINNFKPLKYKYENEQIFLNENYSNNNNEQPIQPPIVNTPSSDEELRKIFGSLQMSSVQTVKMVMDLSKQVAALTKQNVELQKQLNDKGVE
ncbi:DUF2977 domain-containing protein [Mammaliicoccus sciuri]|uniref:DUF2977 domain-containing protein n=1 Tax=Mammaliicoccus sciuri TaxID=1296 RepID=UPI00194FCA77|nr:DUF2977 domain-containing protein [Mammaliicoccus sciuri]